MGTEKDASCVRILFYLFPPSLYRRLSMPKLLVLMVFTSLISLLGFLGFYECKLFLIRRRSVHFLHYQNLRALTQIGFPLKHTVLKSVDSLRSPSPQKCVLPPLQLDDPLMMSFVRNQRAIKCPFATSEWVHVQNGTLVYSKEALASVGQFMCDVSPLLRRPKDDNVVQWGKTIHNFSSGTKLVSDFFKVECRLLNRLAKPTPRGPPEAPAAEVRGRPRASVGPPINSFYDYTDILMGVSPGNEAVWSRLRDTKPNANGLSGLSVLMLGFDSMSRMSWLRRMKSSREYLVNRLRGIELEGYNIMGDGTPAALIPILTGKYFGDLRNALSPNAALSKPGVYTSDTNSQPVSVSHGFPGRHETELPESRRHHRRAKPVDGYPWIWKDFAKVGYVTSWADSVVTIAPFNYRSMEFFYVTNFRKLY